MTTETENAILPQHELRFAFGKNWLRFLNRMNEQRIGNAVESLKVLLQEEDLSGKRFLDVGSGSGLFSLAAHRLGAEVVSFDYDSASVACTREMKHRYASGNPSWKIETGSALDQNYLRQLGEFDIVYSWGVLHHTGEMWKALDNILIPLSDKGKLAIAIYHDQGWKSTCWTGIKKFYCSSEVGKVIVSSIFVPGFLLGFFCADVLKGRSPFQRYRTNNDPRGMSVVTDIIDWIGGYPFEVASPSAVETFFAERGCAIVSSNLTSGLGCSEFLLERDE